MSFKVDVICFESALNHMRYNLTRQEVAWSTKTQWGA